MIVFKTFLKVLNRCKFIIILYTAMLIFFGAFNISSNDNQTNFIASKPDVLIVNKDENIGITQDLINYIDNNCEVKDDIQKTEDKMNDALFYRDVNYIIYIPENFRVDFLQNKNPKIEIKSTGDYQSSLAEMLLDRYIKVANIYVTKNYTEDEIIKNINETLENEIQIEMTSKLDINNLSKATFYYNFANYSFLAGTIYVICLVISSFKEENVNKRTIISSMNYKKHNRILLLSNGLFAMILWLLYVIISFVLIGNEMYTSHGLIYIINSFVFTICCVTIAFLIANLVKNKEAINGIVNVVGLGSSFLCGAFVPVEWLPDSILKIAHILPSYWYIQTNESVKTLEVVSSETLKPIVTNMIVVLAFSLIFIILANTVSKKKRQIA